MTFGGTLADPHQKDKNYAWKDGNCCPSALLLGEKEQDMGVKTLEWGDSGSFQTGDTLICWKSSAYNLSSLHLFLSCVLHTKLVNKCFPESWKLFCWITQLEVGLWGPLNLYSVDLQYGCSLASESDSLWDSTLTCACCCQNWGKVLDTQLTLENWCGKGHTITVRKII